jgi:large subunit ribosomal protein L18
MAKTDEKILGRQRRKARIRKKVSGTTERPRLSVFRSNRYIYAQLINDGDGKTIASASSSDKEAAGVKKTEAAKLVGERIAKLAIANGVDRVVFDRGGYLYHGRVKAVAEGAREAGLKF